MNIQKDIKLAEYTTFKIGGAARFFIVVKNTEEIIEALKFAKENKLKFFILGGGSNILISDEGFDGLVIKIELCGVNYKDMGDYVLAKAAAGEMWDKFVMDTIDRGLYGIENLSAIPGTVGAAPVQNVGAYGTDVSQVVELVRAVDTEKLEIVEFKNAECLFEYRDSLFKKEKGRYVIIETTFKLNKNGKLNIDYKDLKDYFAERKINGMPTLADVRRAVIDVRWHKLPDWKLWGTAGSFFKNPIISKNEYDSLKEKYPGIPGYPEKDGRVKISLAWVLDKICNVRGVTEGKVGTYGKQALVLVSEPGATAIEVVTLANRLMKIVKDKTGIVVEGEVQWVN